MADKRYLVSDIGGTNIRFATFATDPRERADVTTYRLDAGGKPWRVADALADFVAKFPHAYAAACFGVAGRVKDHDVQITNRPDLIRRDDVAAVLKVPPSRVMLVNDMPPHMACVDRLLPAEVIEVKPGHGNPDDARAVLMPGTGVGTGGAVPLGKGQHRVFPSEGGHIDFAPRDAEQEALLRFLRPLAAEADHANVSNEFVFAGQGLRRIYAFFRDAGRPTLDGVPTPEAVTNNYATDPISKRTTDLYVKLIAAAAGNLALTFAATGGVYLGGGILLSIRQHLATPLFAETFLSSGPPQHRSFMEEVPVRLIDYRDSGLLGSGVLALSLT
jgi:glucokinase